VVRRYNGWQKCKKNPKKNSTKLTPQQKAKAKRRASAAGRPYPNWVDNSWATKQ
jgi:hypothetical protein